MSTFHARVLASVLTIAVWATRAAVPAAQSMTPAQPARDVAARSSVAIVVNTENPLAQISMGDLRHILLGEMTRWPNGRTITIAMRPPGLPERDAIFRLVCGMTESDFARYQLHSAYRGEAQNGFKLLDTAQGVKRFVFNVPGAVGFVRGDEVDNSVKLMTVIGDVPKDPAFGLTLRAR